MLRKILIVSTMHFDLQSAVDLTKLTCPFNTSGPFLFAVIIAEAKVVTTYIREAPAASSDERDELMSDEQQNIKISSKHQQHKKRKMSLT